MSIENQQLQRYAQPIRIISDIQDTDNPFSFQAWYQSHESIIPGQEYALYNQYLVDWYKNKASTTTNKNLQIKLNYLKLLRQLQLFFNNKEIESWYNGINLDNEKEVLLAIPYFAKKLKDIALYYLQLREDVKKSKIKYNLIGTNTGINLQLQEFLLTNYTKKPNTSIAIPALVWRSVPELSSIQDSINIQIEELYDTFQYLDHSPTLSASAYYDIVSNNIETYFQSLGLSLTSAEWIYKTGVFDVSGNDIIDTINVSEELMNKYLGSEKYTSLFYSASTKLDFYSLPIETGNNFFYWPYGPYESNIINLPRYKPIPLSAAAIENLGTGGETISAADTIFIKTAKGLQGAWLRYIPYDESTQTMLATLNANKNTKFRFPFPGYGLSGEDLNWTGYSLVTNPAFFYQPPDIKKSIEDTYWSSSTTLTSHESININLTTLFENKAYPNQRYELADKIRVWPTPPNYTDGLYSGDIREAWLYKMTQTDISIGPGKDTVIIWPYGSLDSERPYPFVPEDVAKVCLPVTLSSIQFDYAIASNALSAADLFLKTGNYQLDRTYATEGAWLSSKTIHYPDLKIDMPLQPSLNCVFTPGNFTSFIWQGPDNFNINQVFKSIDHQPDCKFLTTPNTTYKDHSLCTCRRVLFTPFGHPGNSYTDNAAYCDYVIENPFTASLDFSEWVGSDGNPALQSAGFAWFKTNSKIGFGAGQWIVGGYGTGFNTGLELRTGKSYLYYRQNIRDENIQDNPFPDYCVRHSYNNFTENNFKWMQATKDINGNWVSKESPSSITIHPGENLIYSRVIGSTFTKANSALVTQVINENRGSIWSNYDYLTVPNEYNTANNNTVPQQFTLVYPQFTEIPIGTSLPAQYPRVNSYNSNFVQVVSWKVIDPLGAQYIYNAQSLTITPLITGVYNFEVTVMSSTRVPPPAVNFSGSTSFYYTNTGLYVFNNIPGVTAISGTTLGFPVSTFFIPAPGFVLNTPLYGWDYNISNYTTNTIFGDFGAKPFWATTANIKNEYTGYMGINSWGNYLRLVDGYNVISQPEISELTLNTGNYIEYERKANSDIVWSQPLKQKVTVDKNVWSVLDFNTTAVSNLTSILNINTPELITIPTSKSSSLVLETFVENKPVEVFYNALNSFTWEVTATPIVSQTDFLTITGNKINNPTYPWANLPARYYPNIAVLPTVECLSSVTNLGGFFVPQNLGATQYLNKNYITSNSLTSTALSGIYEDPTKYIAGRGLTKQDQISPFEIITENNTWLKEPPIAGPVAGTINKNVFKKYQKFIPYQTRYESNPRYRYGLTTPSSLQTPWTGPTDTDWKDLQNYPVSFTGELNINNWTDSQILKQFNLQLDNWTTDIFGNQYGLYKSLSGVQPNNRKNIPGEIWVRKNTQRVLPASTALSGVFDTYSNLNLYNELTGSGVYQIDVFFDTLYIQTANVIFFERLIYEFENDNILSLADEARNISLALPVTTNLNRELSGLTLTEFAKAGDSWFFPDRKQVLQSVCGLSGTVLLPELYLYDLNGIRLTKVFPVKQTDIIDINTLSSLNVQFFNAPLLTHNNLKKEFVLTIQCQNSNNQDVIIEIIINDYPVLELKNINVYNSNTVITQPLPPIITQPLYAVQNYLSSFNIQITAENGPAVFTGLSLPSWTSLTIGGLFTGTIPTTGIYTLPFIVNNNVGPAYYTLTINAV